MIKRETANICTVQDILKGNFIKTEGWAPSYFETEIGNLSRISIMGVIVEREDRDLILDDGSSKIALRSFDNSITGFEIGDFVQVIGRPRIYNENKYILPEIIKKIKSNWAEYRKFQLENMKRIPGIKKEVHPQPILKEEGDNPFQKIIIFIKDLDSGDGAHIDEVIKRSKIQNANEIIKKLIEEGEIFEIRAGKLKILE